MDFAKLADENSHSINLKDKNIALVMAAGHGKRIRSSLPKVAHKVWGRPSVERVMNAATEGIKTKNEVMVVGRQADRVIDLLGCKPNRVFAFQKEQLGTGHAVREGVKKIPKSYSGNLFILPGDVGLIDAKTLAFFKRKFSRSKASMMLLTGMYRGVSDQNYYGRVIRVPEVDAKGELAPEGDVGKVISIVQHKDILDLNPSIPMNLVYRGRSYLFSRQQLLETNEFDSAIFAFNFAALNKYIDKLENKNVQNEYYLTDLVEIFNQSGLQVESVTPPNAHEVLLGFNDKTVWRSIEQVYRKRSFNRLKNILDLEDENRFFIDEKVITSLEKMDKTGPLDIFIGSGVTISEDVKLGRGVSIGENSQLEGKVVIEEGVKIGARVMISTLPNQQLVIRKNSVVEGNNMIKGRVEIKSNSFVAESVNITGSDEYPSLIGEGATLLGTCYLFGTHVAAGAIIESSILIRKKIKCLRKKDGEVQPVKFYIPPPEGTEMVVDIN